MWTRLSTNLGVTNKNSESDASSEEAQNSANRDKPRVQRSFGSFLSSYEGRRRNSLVEDKETISESIPQSQPRGIGSASSGSTRTTGIFSRVRGSIGSSTDTEMDRQVSQAARNLVQNITPFETNDSSRDSNEWKNQLLDLLCGNFVEVNTSTARESTSDLDILLRNKNCEKFVLRCVEQELPPKLIQCLRLLRRLEFDNANMETNHNGEQNDEENVENLHLLSKVATSKVKVVLCMLCVDPIVGEQLRPVLFRLLALSGASYPPNGVHIAEAASDVILAFGEQCLSVPIVQFLHERDIIVRMTDDIKELCGMTEQSSSVGLRSLSGLDAERAGLWVISLKTIVYLVTYSCQCGCVELIADFEGAGGYHILTYAILHSNGNNISDILKLVSMLIYSQTILPHETNSSLGENQSSFFNEESKLVRNIHAFVIIEDLMVRALPFLKTYSETHQGKLPDISVSNLKELSAMSIIIGKKTHSSKTDADCHALSEILIMTLQLYSDHGRNYNIVEPKFNILSQYLLSYPTFTDPSLKVLTLKTLEYVCTGIPESDILKPLTVASEIFAAMCSTLLGGEHGAYRDEIKADAEMICQTLEKLLQVDERIIQILYECGLQDEKMNNFLSLVVSKSEKPSGLTHEDDSKLTDDCTPGPPQRTDIDEPFSMLCRILRFVTCQQSANGNVYASQHLSDPHQQSMYSGRINLHVLLTMGVTSLGDQASKSALSVFEAILSDRKAPASFHDDVSCLVDLMEQLTTATSKRYPTNAICLNGVDSKSILRQIQVINVFEISFRTNELVQEIFRKGGGYESLIRAVSSVKNGYELPVNIGSNISDKEKNEEPAPIKDLLSSIFSLLNLATTPLNPGKQHSQKLYNEDPSGNSTSETNKKYLQRSGFYRNFSNAIMNTGILNSEKNAYYVIQLSFLLMAPTYSLTDNSSFQGCKSLQYIDNPDASRLVLGIAASLKPELMSISKNALDAILDVCSIEKTGSTLPQMAGCGLALSLTKANEFGSFIGNQNHALYAQFTLLLRRLTSFNMSYTDFIGLLRCIAGPILLHDTENYKRNQGRIDIPVISSSIQSSNRRNQALSNGQESIDEAFLSMESNFCARLETLSIIAQEGDRVSRCILGGDNLNTVALYLQKIPIEQRFLYLAKEGKVKYIKIKSVDSSALQTNIFSGAASNNSAVVGEKIWSPFITSGFTYSLWLRIPSDSSFPLEGSIFLLDLSSNNVEDNSYSSQQQNLPVASCEFLSVWYNTSSQRICVLTSSTARSEPVAFPPTPLCEGVWHHILVTYQPPKRSILHKKAVLNVYINGRSLGGDVFVENVNLPPTSQVHIGVPNPVFAATGIVRDSLPLWELGPSLFITEILSSNDATAIFSAGPDFKGLFWGDRPQRLSLTATATATFEMLAENGEKGSVASALRRRNMPEVEATGQVVRGKRSQDDNLASAGLLCSIKYENVVFGFNANANRNSTTQKGWKILVNVARLNSANVSTDAHVFGNACIVDPGNFADNVQWIGGPKLLLPLVNAVKTSATLALTLRIIREAAQRHLPNLENLQEGGGYRILGLLLRQKPVMDSSVMDECFAFGVHGFKPGSTTESLKRISDSEILVPTWTETENWVLSDLHAIKYLLLNHQVWDLRKIGPDLPLRLLAFFNALVSHKNFHAAFNSRRLHLLGVVKWTIHLMLEAAELYDNTTENFSSNSSTSERQGRRTNASSQSWKITPPSIKSVAVGADPDNPILQSCKSLLRRVLTFMLTPDDLRDISGAIIYTLSITNGVSISTLESLESDAFFDDKIPPGPVARIYLLRLLEELVVDGVNEIVSANVEVSGTSRKEINSNKDGFGMQQGTGGFSSNQSYLSSTMGTLRKQRSSIEDVVQHPKHQQAQVFLSAFASILTPIWFACVLEGSHDEASASAALRLLILMLQSSRTFCSTFEQSSGFSPLVLSIPKFSTSPSIIMALLSQLLHAPILRLPFLSSLDASLLMEVFDMESDASELVSLESIQGRPSTNSDPSCGIFALLAECLGRNIQLGSNENALGMKARETNDAVIRLLSHRHSFSSLFQDFCRTQDFLEPLAQSLCLIHDAKMQAQMQALGDSTNVIGDEANSENYDIQSTELFAGHQLIQQESHGLNIKRQRRASLATVDTKTSPTERFVGADDDAYTASGFGMVQLIHLVLSHAVLNGQLAAVLLFDLFRSFPIHASLQQVEAYHLVLIEHCSTVVEDALQRGQPVAIANCIGLSSVLLDRVMNGFFTSEPLLNSVNIILKTLRFLTATGTYASRTLGSAEQNMLVADTAHLARLTCLTALRRSCSRNPYDEGDADLKFEVLKKIAANLRQLLLQPGGSNVQGGKRGQNNHVGSYDPPAFGTPIYVLYLNSSLTRYPPNSRSCNYPDLHAVEQPDRSFVVALMSSIHEILRDERLDIREQAVEVVVSLLQQRKGFMSELLIADVHNGDEKTETIDLMNRGGFCALLVAHEAATIAENISTVPRRTTLHSRKAAHTGKAKYSSFFEWLERNQGQVDAVFTRVRILSSKLHPELGTGPATPEDAIENEQKVMLLKMTAQDTSDRTIQGGLERAEQARGLHEKTAKSHAAWKRQGFDDLSSGAMKWKMLLRQLKGTHSIWEGGDVCIEEKNLPKHLKNESRDDNDLFNSTLQSRWKLDLSEGYERQRRRLLPNYEFQKLYNLDKTQDSFVNTESLESIPTHDGSDTNSAEVSKLDLSTEVNETHRQSIIFNQNQVEATTALLRKMKLSTNYNNSIESFYKDDDDSTVNEGNYEDEFSVDETDQDQFSNPSASIIGNLLEESNNKKRNQSIDIETASETSDDVSSNGNEVDIDENDVTDNIFASSYDVITGILEPGDWPEKSYNVKRCTGLEVRDALLLWCRDAIYIVDGFEQTEGDGLEGKINRLEKSTSTFYINLRSNDSVSIEREQKNMESTTENAHNISHSNGRPPSNLTRNDNKEGQSHVAEDEVTYQHTSRRISFSDIHSVYRRRYQLQQIALELFDVHRNGTLVAFSSKTEREEVLAKVLQSPLPNSIFSSKNQSGAYAINYDKFMNSLRAKITHEWVQGRVTNFDFLMHLNSFAGRTYNDLTQYPVFPWILSDYTSEEIDLKDPKSFRDLSKPMGAQTEERAQQFKDRFEVLESNTSMSEHEPPPFHYGTHYSCAAYVLHYLTRLEPFSRLALSLQGGRFDVPDRLFHSVESSWKSASVENLQDVREVIPEFFYFPEFLENIDMFDFGTTQSGKVVHHVTLPPWAKGDPRKFIRINRQALESEYVSRHLHNWIDLIFGYKQRGREAVKALNTFVHLTYEGQVDLDAISDPIERAATIAQIHNFGQTPSRLARKPFPQRNIFNAAKEKSIDFNALPFLAALTPPFCVVGATHRVCLQALTWDTCRVGMAGQSDSSVGDICLVKGQLFGVGHTCCFFNPFKRYFRFGGLNNGVSVHVGIPSAKNREVDQVLSIHDGMHRAPITVAKPSRDGQWLITGCEDSTVRVWKYFGKRVHLEATLCGHEGGRVTCLDVSTTDGTIVTGGADGNVLVWDLRRLTFVRQLLHGGNSKKSSMTSYQNNDSSSQNAVISVSINIKNGNVLTLVGTLLSLFDINGNILGKTSLDSYDSPSRPSCAIATACPEWMEEGIVAVTGHVNGDVRLWSLDNKNECFIMRHLAPDKIHSCPITCLRVPGEKDHTLLVGDKSGKISEFKSLRLDNFSQDEQNTILEEMKTGTVVSDMESSKSSDINENELDRTWV